jgi:hypothetical protein
MIRSTWLQFRTQAMVGVGGLLVVAVVLAVTGPHLVHLFDADVATCGAHADCPIAISSFLQVDRGLQIGLDVLVVLVPALIGVFWGAPLVARELETGTYRLAWTQSVTRTRWLAVKLGVVGLAGMVVAGLLSLAVTWWSSPVDRANLGVFSSFDQRDLVPVGYAAFAFALGAATGLVVRRTVPAMAATLVVFVTTRLLVNHFVRPQLLVAPVQHSYPLALGTTISGYGGSNGSPASLFPGAPNIPNAWILSTDIVDKTGHPLTAGVVSRACPQLATVLGGPGPATGVQVKGGGLSSAGPAPAAANQALQNCVSKVGASYHELVTYQPPGHYWPLQWYELAIYLGAALVIGGICLWRIRRSLS